ncbi:hypothetical protein FO519_004179, partial [Halicephalobus sp. NKZ332]
MFYHAYNGYLEKAYPLDELKPLTCTGMDTWGSFSLTLIDSLDTLIIMGNHSEFKRAVNLILKNIDPEANVNVSVFETNIRVVGGLLSAHILSGQVPDFEFNEGWPCSGPLLDLAVKFATKLLPAFNTATGMPFGTVNLKYGVNRFETPVTCTAGVGTFIIEFGTISRLTGDPHFERVALRALDALWKSKSSLKLVGNHINTDTGIWTATDAGIGAGVDSYFEYLAKGGLLLQRPKLLQQFYEYEEAINKHVRKDDWFMWVSMAKGTVSFPIFQSLEAFWPGVLALLGKIEDATRILLTYFQINRQFGLTPEFYNLPNHETSKDRSGYPLRPEMIESMMYVYRATKDPTYLHSAAAMVEAMEHGTKTPCGYATVKDVNDYTLEDRMESFFLAETTKYLYLLFDEDNFIHNDGSTSKLIQTTSGNCVIDAGGYIFNTEAHPIDPAILYCCSSKKAEDVGKLQKFEDEMDFIGLLDLRDPFLQHVAEEYFDEDDLSLELKEIDLDQEESSFEIEAKIEEEEKRWNNVDENKVKSSEKKPEPKPPDLEEKEEPIFKFGVEAAESEKIVLLDPKLSTSKTELLERIKVNKEINELIEKATSHDKKQHEAGDFKSNMAGEIRRMLNDMKYEYSQLLRISNSLEIPNMEVIKVQLAKRKHVMEQPGPEVFLEDSCVFLDKTSDSLALRRMLNIIYSRHIYSNHGIKFVQGPICRPEDRPPTMEELYFNNPPSLSSMDNYPQSLDAVNEFSFSTFRYKLYAEENYYLLTSETCSFASRFAGQKVSVYGWLLKKRYDSFLVIHDKYGFVQAKVPEDSKFREVVSTIKLEDVLKITGVVQSRGRDVNPNMETGEIEVFIYVYIELRRSSLQRALHLRAEIVKKIRRSLEDKYGFVEVETPTLATHTPGGAAEFVVPTQMKGETYALPQSPQLYKQLLMIGQMDRYYQ